MFYRWLRDQVYTIADFSALYRGCPIFIIGGSPLLKSAPLSDLEGSRLPTLALNNVPYVYERPTMWLTADKPSCFGGHLFARSDVLKFGNMSRKDDVVQSTGLTVKEHPTLFFYSAAEPVTLESFFSEAPEFVWWKSVFPIALQLCWRLGARRVYLVGCGFSNRGGETYAWDTELTERQSDYSQRTYNDDIRRLARLKPLFDQRGFEVFSCTPNSRANSILPFITLHDAIKRESAATPRPIPSTELTHSSEHLIRK